MRFAVAVWSCALACCATAPVRPEIPLASSWSVALDAPGAPTQRGSFWDRFESRELRALQRDASEHGFDQTAAAARLAEQTARERGARAAQYPALVASVDVLGQSDNNRRLGNVRGGFVDAGLSATYEVDVWGQHRDRTSAEKARSDASRFEQAAIRLAVAAEVAETYFEILSLRERKARALATLGATQRVLELVEARERAGAALAREGAQQRALVAAETAHLEQLATAESDAHVSLALLLGREPSAVEIRADTLQSVTDPAVTRDDLSVPTTLLSRRPDVARAEAELTAAHADVQAARAALLPQLRLIVSAGVQSVFLTGDYDGSGLIYSGGASLTQPIFDGGALSAERDAASARRAYAEAQYRRTVLQAVGEVERALRGRAGVQRQLEQQERALSEARRAFELVEIEYQAGAGDLLAVLEAQKTLFQLEDELSRLRLTKLRAAVALIRALGAADSDVTARAAESHAPARQGSEASLVAENPSPAATSPNLRHAAPVRGVPP